MLLKIEVASSHPATSLSSCDIHRSNSLVAFANSTRRIINYNYDLDRKVKQVTVDGTEKIITVKFASEYILLGGTANGYVYIFNFKPENGTRIDIGAFDDTPITWIDVNPDGQHFLTTSSNQVKIWHNSKNWSNITLVENQSKFHQKDITQAKFNPAYSNVFATASLDKTVKIWSLGSFVASATLIGHKAEVTCLEFLSDASLIASGSNDATVKIWKMANGNCVRTIPGKHFQFDNVTSLARNSVFNVFVIGSFSGKLLFFDKSCDKLLQMVNNNSPITNLTCQEGQPQILVGLTERWERVTLSLSKPIVSMDVEARKVYIAKSCSVMMMDLLNCYQNFYVFRDGVNIRHQQSEIFKTDFLPEQIENSLGGQFIAVVGQGKYAVFSSDTYEEKHSGTAQKLVWAHEDGIFALLKDEFKVAILNNMKRISFVTLVAAVKSIFGGPLLGIITNDCVSFYNWETLNLIEHIDKTTVNVYPIFRPTDVAWSGSGQFCSIVTKDITHILTFEKSLSSLYKDAKSQVSQQVGIQEGLVDESQTQDEVPRHLHDSGFKLCLNLEESLVSVWWYSEALIFSTRTKKLGYAVSGRVVTIAQMTRCGTIIGYRADEHRIYLFDDLLNIFSYRLLSSPVLFNSLVSINKLEEAKSLMDYLPARDRIEADKTLKEAMDISELDIQSNKPNPKRMALSQGYVIQGTCKLLTLKFLREQGLTRICHYVEQAFGTTYEEAIAQLDDKGSMEDMVAERYEIISSERETRQSTTSGVYSQASSSSSDQNGNPLESNSIFPTIDYLTTQASHDESIPVGNYSQTPDQNFEIPSPTQNLVLNSEDVVFAQKPDKIDKPLLCKTNDTKNGTCNSQDVEISPVSSHSSDFIISSPEGSPILSIVRNRSKRCSSNNTSFSPRLNFTTSLTSKNNNLEETPCKGDINSPKSLCEDTLMASPSSWCSDVGDISSDFVNHQNKATDVGRMVERAKKVGEEDPTFSPGSSQSDSPPDSPLLNQVCRRSRRIAEKSVAFKMDKFCCLKEEYNEKFHFHIQVDPLKGRGVFANDFFEKGDYILEYAGILTSGPKTRDENFLDSQDEASGFKYFFELGKTQFCIDATEEDGRLGRLINHRRNFPNLKPKVVFYPQNSKIPRIVFVAIRKIDIGEELLFDYGDRSKAAVLANPWLLV